MTVHSKLWEATTAYYGDTFKRTRNDCILPPFRYTCPSIAVLDAPGKLYPAGGTTATPFHDWMLPLSQSLQMALDSGIEGLIILTDKSSPACKRANPRYKKNEKVAETPASPNPDKVEVWRTYVTEYLTPQSSIAQNISYVQTARTMTRYDWMVPPATASEPGQMVFIHYMANPQFKQFFQIECCHFWADTLKIKPNQWLCIMGSNFKRIIVGTEAVIDEKLFDFDYKEADPIIGHIITSFKGYNVNVISIDGDVVLLALLAQHHLFSSGAEFNTIKFSRQVNVIHKWNALKKELVYFDIELMWRKISQVHLSAWKVASVNHMSCPIMPFIIIALLNGNDYILHFPQLSPSVYFDAFFSHADQFTNLTSDWSTDTSSPIKLNCSAIVSLVALTYKQKKPGIVLSNNLEVLAKNISNQFDGKLQIDLPASRFRQTLGNISFYLTYIMWAQYGQLPPGEFAQDTNGNSFYGYAIEYVDGKTVYNYIDVPYVEHLEI